MTTSPRDNKPAKDMTHVERQAELARVKARIANGFGEGSGSPGEWWYERADELRHWMDKDPEPPKDKMTAPDFRALAIEIVDGIRGYTFEFSSHPAAHKDDYDFIEQKLRTALSATTEGADR